MFSLLFVPVCPAGPEKKGRKELEITLPYRLFNCLPQVTIPLLDTCITCALKLGHRSNSPMNVWSKLYLLAVSWQEGYCLLEPFLPHSITPTIIVPRRFLPSILSWKICARAPWTQDAVYYDSVNLSQMPALQNDFGAWKFFHGRISLVNWK